MHEAYPNLTAEIAKRGIKKNKIAAELGISERALYSKLRGSTSFTWEEACRIQKGFFPDKEKDMLFAQVEAVENAVKGTARQKNA